MQDLGETRFNQPGSGLYAFILDRDGSALWHSPSARTLADRLDTFNYAVDLAAHLPLGDVRFAPCEWQRSRTAILRVPKKSNSTILGKRAAAPHHVRPAGRPRPCVKQRAAGLWALSLF